MVQLRHTLWVKRRSDGGGTRAAQGRRVGSRVRLAGVLDEGQDWAILSVEPVEGQDPVAVLDEAEDFLRNWLHYVRRAGLEPAVAGAADAQMLAACSKEGIAALATLVAIWMSTSDM